MNPQIFNLDQIRSVLESLDPIQSIEDGFVAYSRGNTTVPPVGELLFEDPPGDVHIKYGAIKGDDYFVIKIASGFYDNVKLDLPTFNGLMLVFKQKTGELACILLDEGHLTNIRTAAAGAVAAKVLAPNNVFGIGVFGAGVQGRLQVQYLQSITDCKKVYAWGISQDELDLYTNDMESMGYDVSTTQDPEIIASNCNLIVMATPAKSPLLQADQIRKGTHITAMGSDTPEKNELDPSILKNADIVVADSISQCMVRGEIFHALKEGQINTDDIYELGHVIENKALHRSSEDMISVADLTGVAVQDIQISVAVYKALTGSP